MSLPNKYRPRCFADVRGQLAAVRELENYVKRGDIPRAIIFSGPYGTGKTTLARILAKCVMKKADPVEVNCAEFEKPMEAVHDIVGRAGFRHVMTGEPIVWIMDEFQALSRATKAQEACLHIFEEARHAHYFLCTTDPDKIVAPIRSRCHTINLQPISSDEITRLVVEVARKEKIKLLDEVTERIKDIAEGSARDALVLLDKLQGHLSKYHLQILDKNDATRISKSLAAAIIKLQCRWSEVAPILKSVEGENPEKIRRGIIGYCRAILLKTPAKNAFTNRVFTVLQSFNEHCYDSGHAGLAAMAYEVCL